MCRPCPLFDSSCTDIDEPIRGDAYLSIVTYLRALEYHDETEEEEDGEEEEDDREAAEARVAREAEEAREAEAALIRSLPKEVLHRLAVMEREKEEAAQRVRQLGDTLPTRALANPARLQPRALTPHDCSPARPSP